MRGVLALVFMAFCLLAAVAYQAGQQEFRIRRLRTQIALSTEQVKVKEEEIVSAKLKMQQLNQEIAPLNKERDDLKKKMEELKKGKTDSETKLGTCQTQKTEAEKKKTEGAGALEKLKADQTAEEVKAQEEIQNLVKQIQERDAKICQHVDEKQEEGRKFCVDKKAAQ